MSNPTATTPLLPTEGRVLLHIIREAEHDGQPFPAAIKRQMSEIFRLLKIEHDGAVDAIGFYLRSDDGQKLKRLCPSAHMGVATPDDHGVWEGPVLYCTQYDLHYVAHIISALADMRVEINAP